MEKTIFPAKSSAVTASCLAAVATILSFFGAGICFVGNVIVLYFLSRSFKGRARDLIVPVALAIWGVYCILDFSAPFGAVTNTPSVLTAGIFAGSLLQSVGSVLLFVGSLFDFEYLSLFRFGALSTAAGRLLAFTITTLFVLKDGGSLFGMSLFDLLSTLGIFVEAALCIVIFFFAKRAK